jgi:hypothetical protein
LKVGEHAMNVDERLGKRGCAGAGIGEISRMC